MSVGDWRSLGKAWDGTEQFTRTCPHTGDVQLRTVNPDVTPVIERNKQLQNMGHGNGKDMKLAASLPLSVVFEWKVRHGVDVFSSDPDQKKAARRLLNDRNNKFLRIWEGNL